MWNPILYPFSLTFLPIVLVYPTSNLRVYPNYPSCLSYFSSLTILTILFIVHFFFPVHSSYSSCLSYLSFLTILNILSIYLSIIFVCLSYLSFLTILNILSIYLSILHILPVCSTFSYYSIYSSFYFTYLSVLSYPFFLLSTLLAIYPSFLSIRNIFKAVLVTSSVKFSLSEIMLITISLDACICV